MNFTQTYWREGYAISEVDAFIAKIQHGEILNSKEIDEIRFTPVRLRKGYAIDEVDLYLEKTSEKFRKV